MGEALVLPGGRSYAILLLSILRSPGPCGRPVVDCIGLSPLLSPSYPILFVLTPDCQLAEEAKLEIVREGGDLAGLAGSWGWGVPGPAWAEVPSAR